jgi:UDP:flavonoid glycosyltransferase YjiC (YdhE family)
MAKILGIWEFGAGWGHLHKIWPIVQQLQRHGHELHLALKSAPPEGMFSQGELSISILPSAEVPPVDKFPEIENYEQMLHNLGMGSGEYLLHKTNYWLELYRSIQPDLILLESAPLALFAASLLQLNCGILGTGFSCPPCMGQLPRFKPDSQVIPACLTALANGNRLRAEYRLAPLENLAEIYRTARQQFLITFPELDHFGPRSNVSYWGNWNVSSTTTEPLPVGKEPHVFAYLKPTMQLERLVHALRVLRWPAVVACADFSEQSIKEFSDSKLRLTRRVTNMKASLEWCDLCILNATEGTVAQALLAGKPTWNLPLNQEQFLLSKRLLNQGLALRLAWEKSLNLANDLAVALQDQYPLLKKQAAFYQRQYQNYQPELALHQLVTQIEAML